MFLNLPDFETQQANTASLETVILQHVVPPDMAYRFTKEPMEMYLATKDTAVGDGGTTDFAMTFDIPNSPNLGDNGGVIVAYVDNVLTAISAINYATKTVSFAAAPANTKAIEFYHLFQVGNVKVRIEAPSGSPFKQLYTKRIENLHVTDQQNEKSAPRLTNTFIAPENFKVQVLINSAALADFTTAENTITHISLPYTLHDMSEFPADIAKRVSYAMV